MAKRVRGQRSTHRPGGVAPARPDRDPSTAGASASDVTTPSTASAAIAGESDATSPIASNAAVVTTSSRAATASRVMRPRTKLRSSGLDQKAAAETEWVTDDLRRIAVISALMVGGLAIAWVLLVVVGLGDIY